LSFDAGGLKAEGFPLPPRCPGETRSLSRALAPEAWMEEILRCVAEELDRLADKIGRAKPISAIPRGWNARESFAVTFVSEASSPMKLAVGREINHGTRRCVNAAGWF
jgi:hypothetical protein